MRKYLYKANLIITSTRPWRYTRVRCFSIHTANSFAAILDDEIMDTIRNTIIKTQISSLVWTDDWTDILTVVITAAPTADKSVVITIAITVVKTVVFWVNLITVFWNWGGKEKGHRLRSGVLKKMDNQWFSMQNYRQLQVYAHFLLKISGSFDWPSQF